MRIILFVIKFLHSYTHLQFIELWIFYFNEYGMKNKNLAYFFFFSSFVLVFITLVLLRIKAMGVDKLYRQRKSIQLRLYDEVVSLDYAKM